MSASSDPNISTIGQRVGIALESEGRSQGSLETALKERGLLGKSRGTVSSLISGRRGPPKVELVMAVADILHVRLDWLLRGEAPMKRDGRVEQTPFEVAMWSARRAGCREDAIQEAWAKLQDQKDTLDVYEWSLAFHRAALDLDARKVPRPEAVVAEQGAIQREQGKLERLRLEAARPAVDTDSELAPPPPLVSRRTATGA